MRDDLRALVERDLPKLAHQIASQALGRVNARFPNHFRYEIIDYGHAMHYAGPVDMGGGEIGYRYYPWHKDGRPHDKGRIIFHNVRCVEVEDVDLGEVQELSRGETSETIAIKRTNNGSSRIPVKFTQAEKQAQSSEQTVSAEFSVEYERTVEASAKAGIKFVEAEAKVTEKFTAKMGASASSRWSQSDSIAASLQERYFVPPRSRWELIIQKTTKHVRQDVLVTGRIQPNVRIDSQDGCSADWSTLEDLFDTFRGLGLDGDKWGRWYRERQPGRQLADSTVDSWPLPRLKLNLPIEGQRTRFSEGTVNEKAL